MPSTNKYPRRITYGLDDRTRSKRPVRVVDQIEIGDAAFSVNPDHSVAHRRASALALNGIGLHETEVGPRLKLAPRSAAVYSSRATTALGGHGLAQGIHRAFAGQEDESGLFRITSPLTLDVGDRQLIEEHMPILQLIAAGLESKQIAGRLLLSQTRVIRTISDLRYELDVQHSAAVVMLSQLAGYSLDLVDHVDEPVLGSPAELYEFVELGALLDDKIPA